MGLPNYTLRIAITGAFNVTIVELVALLCHVRTYDDVSNSTLDFITTVHAAAEQLV